MKNDAVNCGEMKAKHLSDFYILYSRLHLINPKKTAKMPLKTLASLLGCQQELFLKNMRWGRPFSLEGEFKLITHLTSLLRKEEPLRRQQQPDHVFTDSLSPPLCFNSDLTVDVEACMMPTKNLLHKLQTNELFIKQKGEDSPFARPMWNASLIDVIDKKIFRFFLNP